MELMLNEFLIDEVNFFQRNEYSGQRTRDKIRLYQFHAKLQ